jgi:mannitol/fructose-specific phosphotransferase system IIA component (Ntr-type)
MSKLRIHLDKYLSPGAILLDLRATTKQSVLEEMVDKLSNNKIIVNAKLILQELLQREELGSTALAEGIALPHALIPDLSQPIIALGIHPQGINFGHPEGHLTYVFLLILGNKDDPGQQLRFLAHACRLIKETNFVKRVRRALTSQEALKVVQETERELE